MYLSPFQIVYFIPHNFCFMIISIVFSSFQNTTSNYYFILTTHTQQHQPSLPTSHPTAKPPNWTLQFRDIPEAGNRRPVTVRLIADVPITAGNAEAFMSALEYTSVPLPLPPLFPPSLPQSILPTHTTNIHTPKPPSQTSTHHLHGRRLTHNAISILLFQPPSNPLYILQLAVRVADGTKPALMDRGVKELMALKEQLKGVVDVDVVDRAVLDTRVR